MRTHEEINQDYGIKCARLGDLVFRHEAMESEIKKLKVEIQGINEEALVASVEKQKLSVVKDEPSE
jgi:hypothetical protein